ncbi:hypothetical protein J2S74_001592 [Evansella vedderi]|uniref:Zincin peptidase n=1 Tax=Evansella vedderi TaxID=38282 RepID=A0ABT9ZU16_9BACI|nr:DUF3267 domain-containing protein [Evansella vedderi]MDQ0254217.1 hypothetical protein [Evansella vedderi]
MNCWKSISIEKEFGRERLLFMSLIMMLSYFIIHFVFFRTFISNVPFVDFGLPLLFFILSIIPVHILLHCLPIWAFGKKATISIREQWPYCNFSTKQAISKQLLIVSIAFPLVVITLVTIIISVMMPQWMHVMAIVAAINMGLSVYDLLYLKQLIHAPKSCVIEEYENGYNILYKGVRP